MEAAWISKNYGDDLSYTSRKDKYDVIGLAQTRRRHPFNAFYDTGEELFLGTCGSRGVDGVGVNTSLSMNIDSFEQLTTRIGRLPLKPTLVYRPIPALKVFVVYVPTSNYDEEEVEGFYMDLEKFYREGHTFFKVIHHWRFQLQDWSKKNV
ncbi:unnamed protein product [Angiostrongylus costaricensis]|uniref:ABC transporter ATP-binding protein n=1 Tax=Angiostrongylus costaricensis TaxID=334426 RepID=A0A0R3PY11_ANGCS|nr:unnamed protein product [Angiostrongylus costaricensis]